MSGSSTHIIYPRLSIRENVCAKAFYYVVESAEELPLKATYKVSTAADIHTKENSHVARTYSNIYIKHLYIWHNDV